ncbi:phytanoyl hydroxylase [Fusarium subglutinans]|uniref:Phytanoyl hydroxylase n=1 Tax=Gibberella subglutinans TaxID=42677 RepID=A0A8H5Q5J0_GIBSU|nr:phytanoyl hydroxylase [Fusarium subglutinans]KAF5608467.1 phytanoyl hydroxylase [Fusarium subglutinans]
MDIPKLTIKGDTLGRTLDDAFNKKAREGGMTEKERINAFNKNMMCNGFLELGPIKFLQDNGGARWLLTEYEAGDVVFHKPHMIHASIINKDPGNRIRLGTDLRDGLHLFGSMMGCEVTSREKGSNKSVA